MKKRVLSIVLIIIIAALFISGLVYCLSNLDKQVKVGKPIDLTTAIVASTTATTEKATTTEKTTTENKKKITEAKKTTTEKATTTEKITTTEAPTTTEEPTTEIVFEQTYTTAEPIPTTTEAGAEQGEPEIQSLVEEQDIVTDSGETAEPPIGTEVPPVTEEVVSDDPHAGMTYLGDYWQTAYIWTGYPCADGVYPSEGYTVACNNPNLWHRWIYIDGIGARYVHDVGGMSTWEHVDIYVGTMDNVWQVPSQRVGVWLIED